MKQIVNEQSIAHGPDYVSYFRWRTCTFGTEIYWHERVKSVSQQALFEVVQLSHTTL